MDLSKYFIADYKRLLNTHKQQTEQRFIIEHLPADYTAIWNDFSLGKAFVSIFPHMIDQYVKNHSHNFFEFLYVYKGYCKIYIDDSEILLNEKDICILNLQARHSVEEIDLSCNIIYYIMVNPDYFKSTYFQLMYVQSHHVFDFFLESIANHKMINNYILFNSNKNSTLETLTNQVIEESYHNYQYKNEMLNFILSAFFVELSRRYQEYIYTTSKKEIGDYTITEIIDYINSNYKTVTLKDVANHFNYSSTYLSVLIKKYSGISFTEIVHTFRLQKFSQLLIETKYPVTELALDVGISNRTWLIKKFKERYGLTPSEFRQKYKLQQYHSVLPSSGSLKN